MRLLISSTPKILPSLLPEFSPWLGTLVRPGNGTPAQAERLWAAHRMPWGADNAAFAGFDEQAFLAMLRRVRGLPGCLWVAAPDVVADAAATLALFFRWEPRLRADGWQVALVSQDGLDAWPMPWERMDALFVGGSDDWKLSRPSLRLVRDAKDRGKLVHVGRCNSLARYRIAYDAGADSVDGTDVCQWPDIYIPARARFLRSLDRQQVLWEDRP